MFDDLFALSGIAAGGRILEIGAGTGQATIELAKRGFSIVALEPGQNLARLCAANLAQSPSVAVEVSTFEDWQAEAVKFDMVVSATAFHWIEPGFGLQKAATVLQTGGTIALFWNVQRINDQDSTFTQAVNQLHLKYRLDDDAAGRHKSLAATIPDYQRELQHSRFFEGYTSREYVWPKTFSSAEYIALIGTYSRYLVLNQQTRQALFQDFRSWLDTHGGEVTRVITTLLLTARRI